MVENTSVEPGNNFASSASEKSWWICVYIGPELAPSAGEGSDEGINQMAGHVGVGEVCLLGAKYAGQTQIINNSLTM